MPVLMEKLGVFGTLDYIVFSINLLLFVFARPILSRFKSSSDSGVQSAKLWALRCINIVLFGLYVSALFIHDITKQISLTGLTLLLTFIIGHFFQLFILSKFGRVREIEGVEYSTGTYQSKVFSLLVMMIAVIAAVVIVINIWGLTDWLKATSILGVLALLVFSTKDVWVSDNINGLILLYHGDIEPGSVIKVEEYGLTAITIQTTLTQTVFRELKTRHLVTLPNSKLRNTKIEILSKSPASGLLQFAEFNLEYGVPLDVGDSYLEEVWEKACEIEPAINPEKEPTIRISETGDHAVKWRLGYWIKNVYCFYDCELAVNRAAYEIALKRNIILATPLTHVVSVDPGAA